MKVFNGKRFLHFFNAKSGLNKEACRYALNDYLRLFLVQGLNVFHVAIKGDTGFGTYITVS
jgi:hypothetical protein